MCQPANLLADLPSHLPDELVETLLNTPSFRIERIVSYGHASRDDFWYDQDTHEWVLQMLTRWLDHTTGLMKSYRRAPSYGPLQRPHLARSSWTCAGT